MAEAAAKTSQFGAPVRKPERLIVVPRDAFLQPECVQHLLLYFDKAIAWPESRRPLTVEELDFVSNELHFLASAKAAARVAFGVMPDMGFVDPSGAEVDLTAQLFGPYEIGIYVHELCLAQPRLEDEHSVSYGMRAFATKYPWFDPPTVLADPHRLLCGGETSNAIEVVLKSVPTPSPGLPWQDFMEFREDAETKFHLRKLRLWTESIGTSGRTPSSIAEELASLLDDYRRFMRLQAKQSGSSVVSLLIAGGEHVAAGLASANSTAAWRGLVEFGARAAALEAAELMAPGREVAYLARLLDAPLRP